MHMEKLLEKLSSYNILNNLIPGGAFIWLCNFGGISFISSSSIVETLFIYYFCGMVVSRVGSLVVETLCIKAKFFTYAQKKDYIKATKKDQLIEELLETSNLYRTCAGMILTVGICKFYVITSQIFCISREITVWIILCVLFVIFVVAFCKQTRHILWRVDFVKKSREE